MFHFKKLIPVISFLILFSFPVFSQTVKASVSFLGSEFPVGISRIDDNVVQGLSADFDFKVIERNKIRLGGVFNYQRPIIDGQVSQIFESSAINVYSFGPQLSYKIGFVEPFGTALFGVTTFDNNVSLTGKNKFTRTYRGGFDLNISHFFIRPFYVQYQYTEGFRISAVKQYGAGAGVRF